MLRKKRFWLGALISLALLALVFRQTDLAAMGSALAQANYFYLVPALALYFVGVILRAVRWHFLLRSIRAVPVRELFTFVVIGYMANNLLPARIGELVRAYVLGESEHLSKASILVTIFVERLFDGLTMLTFIAGASFYLPVTGDLRTSLTFVSILFIGLVIVLIAIAALHQRLDPLIHFIIRRLPAHWGERTANLIHSFLHGLSVLRNPLDALVAFALSIGAWLCEATMYLVLGLGFGIAKPFAVFVLATAVANLVTIVPSTPGYAGVLDAPIKLTLTQFGVESNLATSFTLVLHATLIVPVTLLGLFLAWRHGLSLGQLTRRADVSLEPTA